MKILVCGGRNYNKYVSIYHALDDVQDDYGHVSEIITGGASGADHWAESWAWMNRSKLSVFKADWKAHGKAAGPLRNQQMIEAQPDLVVAFPGGRGTADMVGRAQRAGVPVLSYVE